MRPSNNYLSTTSARASTSSRRDQQARLPTGIRHDSKSLEIEQPTGATQNCSSSEARCNLYWKRRSAPQHHGDRRPATGNPGLSGPRRFPHGAPAKAGEAQKSTISAKSLSSPPLRAGPVRLPVQICPWTTHENRNSSAREPEFELRWTGTDRTGARSPGPPRLTKKARRCRNSKISCTLFAVNLQLSIQLDSHWLTDSTHEQPSRPAR